LSEKTGIEFVDERTPRGASGDHVNAAKMRSMS
jgi:hypothetical protein